MLEREPYNGDSDRGRKVLAAKLTAVNSKDQFVLNGLQQVSRAMTVAAYGSLWAL
jgi:hypothetical protein